MTFFGLHCRFFTVAFIHFTRVSSVNPWRVSPRTFFYLSNLLCFSHNFFRSGVTPLEGVTRGGPSPSWRHWVFEAVYLFCLLLMLSALLGYSNKYDYRITQHLGEEKLIRFRIDWLIQNRNSGNMNFWNDSRPTDASPARNYDHN